MDLVGRSAVITGANQGLGKAIAAAFVRAGANVLLVARGEDLLRQARDELAPLARHPGQQLHAAAADVSRPEDCAAVVARALELLPGLTVLVNNAGVYGPMGPVEDNDWDE